MENEIMKKDVIIGEDGKENNSAFKVICKAFENLCNEYNPVFVTSSTGNGKTYFMKKGMAFAHANGKKVKNISSTQFQEILCQIFWTSTEKTSDGIFAVTAMYEVFAPYDIVIIENLESLIGMEVTLEWLCYFADYLIGKGKQIFFTSTLPAGELLNRGINLEMWKNFKEVHIPIPSYQFKLETTRRLAKRYDMELDVVQIAAISAGTNSIGAIDSALKQIIAISDLTKCSIKEAANRVITKYLS